MPDAETPPTPRRVWLHVGLHKTGTTWVQNVLHHNRAALAARGVGYPDLTPHHGWPLLRALGGVAPRRAGDPEEVARHARILRETLADPTLRTVILSGEQLSAQMTPDQAARLAAMIAAAGAEARVIAYVRDPVSYAASMTLQRLRAGLTLAELAADPPLPRWRRKIGKHLRVFGPGAVEIRVYDRARLVGGDILSDLLAAIGEPGLDAALERPAGLPANPAMSARGARWLDRRNRLAARLAPRPADRAPPRAARLLERLPGPPFALPPEVRARVLSGCAGDLRWLARRMGENPFAPAPVPAPAPAARDAPAGEG